MCLSTTKFSCVCVRACVRVCMCVRVCVCVCVSKPDHTYTNRQKINYYNTNQLCHIPPHSPVVETACSVRGPASLHVAPVPEEIPKHYTSVDHISSVNFIPLTNSFTGTLVRLHRLRSITSSSVCSNTNRLVNTGSRSRSIAVLQNNSRCG